MPELRQLDSAHPTTYFCQDSLFSGLRVSPGDSIAICCANARCHQAVRGRRPLRRRWLYSAATETAPAFAAAQVQKNLASAFCRQPDLGLHCETLVLHCETGRARRHHRGRSLPACQHTYAHAHLGVHQCGLLLQCRSWPGRLPCSAPAARPAAPMGQRRRRRRRRCRRGH